MSKDRLIPIDATVSKDTVSDILYVLMLNVEEALRVASAKPRKDYK